MIKRSDKIRYSNITEGNYVEIADDVKIICPKLSLGNNVYIGKGSKIKCLELEIGDDTFLEEGILIEGNPNNLETKVKIGKGGLICKDTRINCNYPVTIGENVGIGQNVRIWTHGYFMDRLKGYPYNKGEVKIGNNVWIIEGTSIMPKIDIGNNVIIGTNSVVNKNIPSGVFASGNPVEIIKQNIYPPIINYEQQKYIINEVVSEYIPIMNAKGFEKVIEVNKLRIFFDKTGESPVIFDCKNRCIYGELDKYGEDFRDHLRRNSLKFFNGKPFKSLPLLAFKNLYKQTI